MFHILFESKVRIGDARAVVTVERPRANGLIGHIFHDVG
jgi:hypothetical protein